MTTNGMMPGPSAPPSGPGLAPPQPAQVDPSQMHDQALAQFNKMVEARSTLDKIRVELTNLTKLGDMVSAEDVIKGAGNLVAHGMSPMELAGLLADMPEGGQALAGWVAQHAKSAEQNEIKVSQMISQVRGHLGAAALGVIAQHAQGMSAPASAPGPSVAPNALAPGGPPNG